jgi:hypothetical protein
MLVRSFSSLYFYSALLVSSRRVDVDLISLETWTQVFFTLVLSIQNGTGLWRNSISLGLLAE